MLELQKTQRQNPTPAEEVLWRVLRGGNLEGVRFLRQKAFGRYIVDFYCASAKLVIELDGEVHDTIESQAYDAVRTETLTARGAGGGGSVMHSSWNNLTKFQCNDNVLL